MTTVACSIASAWCRHRWSIAWRLRYGFTWCLLWPVLARAGGFYVPEVGSRAAGMGVAVTANPDDPSAMFHNPAGMIGQGGLQLQLSGTLFLPRLEFFRRPLHDPSTNQTVAFAGIANTNPAQLSGFFGAVTDLGSDCLSAGLAVSVPFGAAVGYPRDGSQRQVVTSVDLKAIHLSLGAAVRLTDRIHLGAAVNYIFADLALGQRNAVPYITGDPEAFPNPEPPLEGDTFLNGNDPFSLSATMGVLYVHPGGAFRAGISLLTPVSLQIAGSARVTNNAITELLGPDGSVVQPAGVRTDRFRTELPLPLILRAGVAVRPHPQVLVAFDFNWQRWSTFDHLTIDFENEPELLPTPGATLYDVTAENHWRDSISLRLGGEVAPVAGWPLRLRSSAFYDQSPIDDRHFDLLTPDSDKFGIGLGAGYQFALSGSTKLGVDLSYQHLFFSERNLDPGKGSAKTILNKPAPSFYYGVTRARFDVVQLAATLAF